MVGKVASCVWPQVQRARAAAAEMDQVKREVAVVVARVPVSVVRVEGAAAPLAGPSCTKGAAKPRRLKARLPASALLAYELVHTRAEHNDIGGPSDRRTTRSPHPLHGTMSADSPLSTPP